jgi:hypothetical protein
MVREALGVHVEVEGVSYGWMDMCRVQAGCEFRELVGIGTYVCMWAQVQMQVDGRRGIKLVRCRSRFKVKVGLGVREECVRLLMNTPVHEEITEDVSGGYALSVWGRQLQTPISWRLRSRTSLLQYLDLCILEETRWSE